ncbi:hypothetical protein BDFB_002751 [Asbolus verrucosus]|uniref:Ribosomal protein mS38 C-terminal domain-containing protein n=1 Tax=Asbolus verrucosus TaxID=1661398 RepID=A0A482VJF4_ASBVE|nr:hypothetical protein BDFB_002751 [Asbolus verrucosus]
MACLSRIVRFNQLKHCVTFARHLTSNNAPVTLLIPHISLTNNNPWIWQKNDKLDLPLVKQIQLELPSGLKYVPQLEDPVQNKEIVLPTTNDGDISKEAARLIVIRRKKMKKHKLKKLRKRMKYEWAKRRQRRELKKEKDFQAVLIKQCKDGEAFSAEKYVEERLTKFNELKAKTRTNKKSSSLQKDQM